MAVRICALGVPRFMHGGLEVTHAWSSVEEVDEKQRATLLGYVGRFIRIHPADASRLGELGLGIEVGANGKPTGRLVEAKKNVAPKSEDNKPAAKPAGKKD